MLFLLLEHFMIDIMQSCSAGVVPINNATVNPAANGVHL
jgi:hypothetical protein